MYYTAQKMKFSIKDFSVNLRIWSHLLKKSLMETFFVQCYKGSLFQSGYANIFVSKPIES